MSVTINGSGGLTFNDGTSQNTAALPGMRNRIINGDMRIDQRNSGASKTVTDTANATFSVDRWPVIASAASKISIQRNAGSVTPPVGFSNYSGVTSLSSYSVLSTDYFAVAQYIEGFNTADLGWGTANAKPVTLSFWVRSSLTGTFGGTFTNQNATRSYPYTYTISSANTWEYKTVTVAGDTTGTWIGATNEIGLKVNFGLGVGSTYRGTAGAWAGTNYVSAAGAASVVGTNGATFYITGVQLEAGSVATPFEYRQYGQELALCQRYYTRFDGGTDLFAGIGMGVASATSNLEVAGTLPQYMRATPTTTFSTLRALGNTAITLNSLLADRCTQNSFYIVFGTTGATIGYAYLMQKNNSATAFLAFSSEL